MKRLTLWYDGYCGKCDLLKKTCATCPDDCALSAPCEGIQNIVDRLAAYEDTGLEPDEIGRLIATNQTHAKKHAEMWQDLEGYLKGEAEGRLLILPCKIGDTVYCIRKNPFAKGRYVKENIAESITVYRDHGISIFSTLDDVLGKTVFLTREEAEAALTGGADG